MTLNDVSQDSYFYAYVTNTSGASETLTNLVLTTANQDRKFGGPIDNTQLGWIMEEADRVMKELAGGKDQLTGATYNSQTPGLPAGFENILERYVANDASGSFANRFWFTPNQETLNRYIDPTSGEATVAFSQSSVELNTEALMLGQPQDPTALAFANWFNKNYAAMEQISFPVHDPTDPTGARIIDVKIFQDLAEAMQAVSLARFFHDNNIPLDTWWLNSYTPQTYNTLAIIPTLTNSLSNGSVTVSFYGGVTIKTPNTYVPAAVAQTLAADVLSQRTPGTGDLPAQEWNVTNTPIGNLNAVAASLAPVQQDANVTLSATDVAVNSPGGEQLTFDRYYNSGVLTDQGLGVGWTPLQYDIQFQYPSMTDDEGLMRDAGGKQIETWVVSGSNELSDTLLREGEIRITDQATGTLLTFESSMQGSYSLDAQGNPVYAVTGLTAGDVPTFTAGMYQDGSTLTQDPATMNYILTRPDGSQVTFLPMGLLLKTVDKRGYAINYNWGEAIYPQYGPGMLMDISDSAGQTLQFGYNSAGRISSVTAEDASGDPLRGVSYVYDSSGRLWQASEIEANSVVATTTYQYDGNNQISGIIGPDGVQTLTDTADLRGRTTTQEDALGNADDYSFSQNSATGATTTQVVDADPAVGNDATAQGVAALQYFATGAANTSTTTLDTSARTTQTTDALGDTTQLGYTGSSTRAQLDHAAHAGPAVDQHPEQFRQPADRDQRSGQHRRHARPDHLHRRRPARHGDRRQGPGHGVHLYRMERRGDCDGGLRHSFV